MKITVNSTAGGEAEKLLVYGPRRSDIVGCTSGRMASRSSGESRGKKMLLLKDKPGLEMRRWYLATGASQKEISENAREREDNNKSGAHLLAHRLRHHLCPMGVLFKVPRPCLDWVLFISSVSLPQ